MSKIFANASSEVPSKEKKSIQFSGQGMLANELRDYYNSSAGKKLSGANSPNTAKQEKETEPEIVPVDLIFWNDGFTINRGPFRPFDDPQGLRLLDNIRSG